MHRGRLDIAVAVACCVIVLFTVIPFSKSYIWSPYYRIQVKPLEVVDYQTQVAIPLPPHAGYTVEVNNDYHQMMLDLHRREQDPPFFKAWRFIYDLPYNNSAALPPGPILVIGAGTGNDVAAALRNTDRDVYAVEIDPAIARLGTQLHRVARHINLALSKR